MSQSRRRARFTVYLAGHRDPKVVLAYSAESARAFYARSHTVLRVERGDYRKQARTVAKQAEGGFILDRAALAAAIELLGLKLPVKIRYNSRVGGTNGNHRLRDDGVRQNHDVMVKSYLTAAQASSTLWHELCHCQQAEKAGGTRATWGRVVSTQKMWPYSSRPIEREARQMSADMADCPLTLDKPSASR